MSQGFSASKLLSPMVVGLLVTIATTGYFGCKKDEPPPPLPSAAPATTPTPTAPLELAPEDAGPVDAADDADAAKRTGGGGSSLSNCCSALNQNAESAPEPNKTYMKQAAAMCTMMVGQGAAPAAILGAISGSLRGAGLPVACR